MVRCIRAGRASAEHCSSLKTLTEAIQAGLSAAYASTAAVSPASSLSGDSEMIVKEVSLRSSDEFSNEEGAAPIVNYMAQQATAVADDMVDATITYYEKQPLLQGEHLALALENYQLKLKEYRRELNRLWFFTHLAVDQYASNRINSMNASAASGALSHPDGIVSRVWGFLCAYAMTVLTIATVWVGIDLTIQIILWSLAKTRALWRRCTTPPHSAD